MPSFRVDPPHCGPADLTRRHRRTCTTHRCREALSSDEQNVTDAVNQFFERLELNIKQILAEEANKLIAQPGISAQLIVTSLEGTVSRYIRSKFKESPSSYSENLWTLTVLSTFKD